MSQKKEVPGSLGAFLKDGIEEAQCNICLEAFDNNHVPIQIKECGHHFGKGCLEKWLKTEASRVGTCPTCRGVLFTAKAKSATRNNQPTAPPTPDRFVQFYIESERARRSTRSGFLAKLWIAVQQLGRANALTTVFHPLDAVVQAYNQVNIHGAVERMPELRVLFPYISYFSHHNDNSSCPLIAVANSLCTLSNIRQLGFYAFGGCLGRRLWRFIPSQARLLLCYYGRDCATRRGDYTSTTSTAIHPVTTRGVFYTCFSASWRCIALNA